jgi:hypothetical protein
MLASYRFSTLRPVNNTLKLRGSKVAMRSPPECLLFNAAQRPTVGQWPERGGQPWGNLCSALSTTRD